MRELTAIECCSDEGERELCSPRVGRFRARVQVGDTLGPGDILGVLQVLNSRYAVVAPAGVTGRVNSLTESRAVEYCGALVVLGAHQASAGQSVSSHKEEDSRGAGGHEVCAPIDGIFYCRPSPDEPLFASPGDEVAAGQTLGLIEVMKTFNPVKLEGPSTPARGILRSVAVRDQQEVSAGQVLFVIEPA